MPDLKLENFDQHRPLLFGIAWRMLGNTADAEDILQEAFLRWQQTPESVVRSPKAFLVTIVTRLCLNHLDRAHVKRERCYGTVVSLEALSGADADPANDGDLADALDAAFSIVLQRLSPVERAVFLLREVFERDYSEVARIVEKSEENCRQILRRARERIAGKEPRFEVTLAQQEAVLREFLFAVENGNLERLARTLASDAILIRDGAALGVAPPSPIQGVETVTQYFAWKAGEGSPSAKTIRKISFRKLPVALVYCDGQLQSALAFVLRDNLIHRILYITCQARLHFLSAQCSRSFAEMDEEYRAVPVDP